MSSFLENYNKTHLTKRPNRARFLNLNYANQFNSPFVKKNMPKVHSNLYRGPISLAPGP